MGSEDVTRRRYRTLIQRLALSTCLAALLAGTDGCGSGVAPSQATSSFAASLSITTSTGFLRVGQSSSVRVSGTQIDPSTAVVTISCAGSGNAGCGTFVAGTYTAPSALPADGAVVTLTATAQPSGQPSVTASTSVGIMNPVPALQTVAPLSVQAGTAILTLTGSGFTAQSNVSVTASNPALQVTSTKSVVNANTISLNVITPATFSGQLSIQVSNPDPGAATSSPVQVNVVSNANLSVTAQSDLVRAGQSTSIAVTGNAIDPSQAVMTLSCQAVGGNGWGSITSNVFTAPAVVPAGGSVTISATVAQPSQVPITNSLSLGILNPLPVLQSVTPMAVKAGVSTLTLKGSGFTAQSSVTITPSDGSVQVQSASAFVDPDTMSVTLTTPSSFAGIVAIVVSNPDPGAATSSPISVGVNASVSYDAAVRFLRQSTYGPTPALIAHVQSVGFSAYLDEQFAAAPSLYNTAQWWQQQRYSIMRNAVMNNDQLRQRVSQALSEIIVTSEFGQSADQTAFPIWMNTLQNDAFSTYGTVLYDSLKMPALSAFLTNIGNNATNDPTQHVAQNLGRELLQLFSVGPYLLNLDGTMQVDSNGNPIPTYDNTVIDGVSRSLTGWNFGCFTGIACSWQSPLAPYDQFHDKTAKTLLNGFTTAAGSTADADLKALVNNLNTHPNIAPFVSKRLIQALVTSNPSPAYVTRISQVFQNDGAGTVGNLKAVVRAILLDAEARAGDDPNVATAGGHFQEPILYSVAAMRALSTTMQPLLTAPPAGEDSPGPWGANDAVDLETWAGAMGEQPLYSPSVFNFYSFQNMLSGTTILAPETQIATSSTAIARANYINDLLYGFLTQDPQDVSWLVSDAALNTTALVSDLNHYLLAGRMDTATCSTITAAVNVIPSSDPNARIRQAMYLFLTSPQYQVIQ